MSILPVIIGITGKSLVAKNEILRSLRSLRMTKWGDFRRGLMASNLEL